MNPNRQTPSTTLPLLFALAAMLPVLHGADWSQFRGEDGQGKAVDADPPISWTRDEGIADCSQGFADRERLCGK